MSASTGQTGLHRVSITRAGRPCLYTALPSIGLELVPAHFVYKRQTAGSCGVPVGIDMYRQSEFSWRNLLEGHPPTPVPESPAALPRKSRPFSSHYLTRAVIINTEPTRTRC